MQGAGDATFALLFSAAQNEVASVVRSSGGTVAIEWNADDDPDIAEKYSVMSIPTFLIFKDGKPVETAIGSVPKSTLQEKLERALH